MLIVVVLKKEINLTSEPGKTEIITTYSYKIFIHEVLAQSINWFENKDLAWGPLGIEKFIHAVQQENAFKNYRRKEECCYSFYVTCGNGLLEHPCTYDTELQRNQALEALHSRLLEFVKKKSYGHEQSGVTILLNDHEGKPFAQLPPERKQSDYDCDFFIKLAEEIMTYEPSISYRQDGYLEYPITEGMIIQSVEQRKTDKKEEQEAWKAVWKKILQYWACYYPIIRTRLKSNGKPASVKSNNNTIAYKYCIELKIPGFNLCEEDTGADKPCGCSDVPARTGGACYIAWKGICCFGSCVEAMAILDKAITLLSDKKNYHPVFDCECNSFGIALHSLHPVLVKAQGGTPVQSDIIAINPQCYEYPKDVCEAVETSCKLVNSEGMHLVEHILLRPVTEADCKCDARIAIQDCQIDCEFPHFISEGAGACAEQDRSICFKPGTDPYSFIATAVLPAWSKRFRQEDNRLAFETLIYREAPAHVLLRILWLKPKDFCQFETAFKEWGKWMGGKDSCGDEFSICKFLDLLIHTQYECMDDSTDCLPCIDPGNEKPVNCIEEQKTLRKLMITKFRKEGSVRFSGLETPHGFLNQVNEIHCFKKYCPGATQTDIYRDTEKKRNIIPKEKLLQTASATKEKTAPSGRKEKATIKKVSHDGKPVKENKEAAAPSVSDFQLKAQAVNSRLGKYQAVVKIVKDQFKNNPLAGKLESFMMSQEADTIKLEKLLNEIMRKETPSKKTAKSLDEGHQQLMIQAAICWYLDKVCFNGKDESLINRLQPIMEHLNKQNIDGQKIYDYWNANEVVKYEPETDIDFIRHVLVESGTSH